MYFNLIFNYCYLCILIYCEQIILMLIQDVNYRKSYQHSISDHISSVGGLRGLGEIPVWYFNTRVGHKYTECNAAIRQRGLITVLIKSRHGRDSDSAVSAIRPVAHFQEIADSAVRKDDFVSKSDTLYQRTKCVFFLL